MANRDDFTTIIGALRDASPTITNEQRKGLLRQAVQNYGLSVDEATEILISIGLVVGEEISYFDVLGCSIDEIQGLDELEIRNLVEVAHNRLYSASLQAGGRPRVDGKSEAEWRTVLNQARDVLTNLQRRQEHIGELSVKQTEESTTAVLQNSNAAITKPHLQIEDIALSEHKGSVNSVAFSPDGTSIVSGSSDNTAVIWDVVSGELKHTLHEHVGDVTSVVYSPDGETIASGSSDKTIRLWNSETGELKNTLIGHKSEIRSVNYSPDGKTLVSGGNDNRVCIWNAISGTFSNILVGHSNWVSAVAFSPDGKTIVSASYDRTVRVWDADRYYNKYTLDGHKNGISSVVFSPDGNTIASTSLYGNVHLWDATTREPQDFLAGHLSWFNVVSFSPSVSYSSDGSTLACGSYYGLIRLWDIATGKFTSTLTGHKSTIKSLAYSPNGQILASCSTDKNVRLWNLNAFVTRLILRGISNTNNINEIPILT